MYVSYEDGRWEIKVDDIIVFDDTKFDMHKESPSGLVRRLLDCVGVKYTGISGKIDEKRFSDINMLFNYMESFAKKSKWIPHDDPRSLRVGFFDLLNNVSVSIGYKDIDNNEKPRFAERYWREEFCKRLNQVNELKYNSENY